MQRGQILQPSTVTIFFIEIFEQLAFCIINCNSTRWSIVAGILIDQSFICHVHQPSGLLQLSVAVLTLEIISVVWTKSCRCGRVLDGIADAGVDAKSNQSGYRFGVAITETVRATENKFPPLPYISHLNLSRHRRMAVISCVQ